jgi:Rod binding domain-containing protein
MKVAPLQSAPVGKSSIPESKNAQKAGLEKASKELEGVFLRQLLEGSGIGKQAGQGYGPMIVDALAGAVSEAGGLGLAKSIALALSPMDAKRLEK